MADLPPSRQRQPLDVLLAYDQDQLLDAPASLLSSKGIRVVGKARTGVGVLQLLEDQPTTAVVVDLQLPDLNGLEVARRVAEIVRRKTAVIIYADHADEQILAEAFDAGARAVVLKDGSPDKLVAAMAEVAAGGTYVDPQLRGDGTTKC